MKRIWFAVVFLLIAAAVCTYEQIYVKNICAELTAQIEEAKALAESGNEKELESKINSIKSNWEKNNSRLFAFSEHAALDNLASSIRSLHADSEDIKDALEETRALTIVFYENQKVTLANVF